MTKKTELTPEERKQAAAEKRKVNNRKYYERHREEVLAYMRGYREAKRKQAEILKQIYKETHPLAADPVEEWKAARRKKADKQ